MTYKLAFLALVIVFLLWIVYKLSAHKKLSVKTIATFTKKINATKKLDPAHAVIESHKIFVAALSFLFSDKKLTAAQKIAKIQKRIHNKNQIWRHHKLRNRIAHETDVKVLQTQADLARKDFIRALKSLG